MVVTFPIDGLRPRSCVCQLHYYHFWVGQHWASFDYFQAEASRVHTLTLDIWLQGKIKQKLTENDGL